MSSCEKCWRDACGDPEKYGLLVNLRKENPCTLEEQAGKDAALCKSCERKTVHQICNFCINRKCEMFAETIKRINK